MNIVFIISFALLFYVLFGYGIIVYIIIKIRNIFRKPINYKVNQVKVSIIVAAYNEEKDIKKKFFNNLDQMYPTDHLQFVYVTDGSTDRTTAILRNLQQKHKSVNIKVLHKNQRLGKTTAMNRAVKYANGEILIFTDANTLLNPEATNKIVWNYRNPKIGAVAGEKRVVDSAEGLYWKYESFLKKLDSDLYSAVGAAGELFSIRKELYTIQPADTILDDLMISIEVIKHGYKIAYEPNAYAIEDGSANYQEEYKRKVRIAAGGVQSMLRLKQFMLPINIFNIQFVSRKVLRWTLSPIAIILLLISNFVLAVEEYHTNSIFWESLFLGQVFVVYIPAIIYLYRPKENSFTYKPFYFLFMHYAIISGWFRYFFTKQNAAWERAARA